MERMGAPLLSHSGPVGLTGLRINGGFARRPDGLRAEARSGVDPPAPRTLSERDYGVFVEVDKVVIDAHNSVHRVAFNQAFKALGHTSVQWTPEVFWQLMRSSTATPDSLVQTYYNTVGWPVRVPVEGREHLTRTIQQKKDDILAGMVERAEVPLRPGVQDFLKDAASSGAAIALLASTCSAPSEGLVDAALALLGKDIADTARVFQCPQSIHADTSSPDDPLSLERSLQAATAHRRQREAQAFMETVNRSKLGVDWREKTAASAPGQLAQRHVGEGMMIDPSLLVATQRFSDLSPAWLAACVATLDVGLGHFALLAGTNHIMRAAQGAGIVSIAVPSSFSGRGSFSGADAVMDGFGAGGGVTWARLCRKIASGRPAAADKSRARSKYRRAAK